ncbi:P-loop NTPase fold protein [Vreelandella venusta]|uniref:KAP family P-loop NTPase fold protein n=1 Tax=Vreelandella venusta TaxID=44935 RepID=UPI00384AEB54
MEGEVFYNENKCNGLIKVLSKLEKNKVVCVDGKWGTGKSYFCKKLIELSEGELECIKFNAFEHDHSEDPLVLLLSEFSKAVPVSKKERYIKTVAKHAAPLMGKGLDYALTLSSLKGVPGVDEASNKLKNYMEQRINNYLYAEKSIVGIKRELKKIVVGNEGKKIVVIIDELDRCRPSFALEIIEKIKHIFNVEGIHFILSMHKEQVLESISHTYGIAKNSESYLEKFLDFTIYLKPEILTEIEGNSPHADYAYHVAKRSFNEIEAFRLSGHVADFCAFLTLKHSIGFREVDRFVDKCLTAYISYNVQDEEEFSEALLACALVSNTFLSIYSMSVLNLGSGMITAGGIKATKMVCSLLLKGYGAPSSIKSTNDIKLPSEAEKSYGGELFYGFLLSIYNSSIDKRNAKVLPDLSSAIDQEYRHPDIVRCFIIWNDNLKEVS